MHFNDRLRDRQPHAGALHGDSLVLHIVDARAVIGDRRHMASLNVTPKIRQLGRFFQKNPRGRSTILAALANRSFTNSL
jgi:hypothetical protein